MCLSLERNWIVFIKIKFSAINSNVRFISIGLVILHGGEKVTLWHAFLRVQCVPKVYSVYAIISMKFFVHDGSVYQFLLQVQFMLRRRKFGIQSFHN